MDFTIEKYRSLVLTLKETKYSLQTYNEFISDNKKRSIVLRHDVDRSPYHSLRFAKIQKEMSIKASYYFRVASESWNERVILEIANLGHEVGYHYETMDTANGDVDLAWDQFRFHLDELRKLVDVKTICMHGSPRSKFDNKDIWKKYDYRTLGILGEPYYDINFYKVLYLTDTGRRWDGWKTSVRDKVPQQEEWINQGLAFHSTDDVVNAVMGGRFPAQVMFTFHPQRWHSKAVPWAKELLFQTFKNQVKQYLFVK